MQPHDVFVPQALVVLHLTLEEELGALRPGMRADLVALDRELHATNVFMGGQPITGT